MGSAWRESGLGTLGRFRNDPRLSDRMGLEASGISMSHESRHRRHRSRSKVRFTESEATSGEQPWLVTLTDLSLLFTFVLVALGFGGRAATGQLFLVAGALLTTTVWLLHQFTSSEARYHWTGSEWLWCTGLLVVGLQIIPLPQAWLLWLSPNLKEILPLVLSGASGSPLSGWQQLSLAPYETASGMATFASYGLLFLVVAQRIRTLQDAERFLCAAGLASVAMGLFALAQYAGSNDKYFWVIDHPYMTTSHCALGCFTNRNHLAQFLALGMGPLVWWTLSRFHFQDQEGELRRPPELHRLAILGLLAAMGVVVLTLLLCYSRGGLLALGISFGVSFALLTRMGLASAKLALGLTTAGAVIAGIFFVTGYETLENRLEGTLNSRDKEGRFVIWQANLAVTRDFPWFGTGIGTHADAYHLHFDKANEDSLEYTHAESGYLQVGSESGVAGLTVAVAMILFSLWAVFRGLRHPQLRYRAATAAVCASLLANLVHAGFDFFWYTPSCMLLLAIQVAALVRLSRSRAETEAEDLITTGFRPPRLVTLAVAGVLGVAGAGMLDAKIPAALAEPSRMQYLYLAHHRTEQGDEDAAELANERGLLLLRAARLDPRDSNLQESAGLEFLRRFDVLQETAENPLACNQIRDVVQASEFESAAAMKEWMDRAVGRNSRLLTMAARAFRRALLASPLRAESYVKAAELGFLNLIPAEQEMEILKQALRLRPHDPQILYLVGRNVMLTGDIEGALEYWRDAFARSRRIQNVIVRQLAPQVDPPFFLDKLKPDWEGLGVIARAYQEFERKDEARRVWEMHIRDGLERMNEPLTEPQLELTFLSLHDACTAIEDRDRAIQVLRQGVERMPQSFLIRNRLGWDLYVSERFTEAAEHLQWCATRRPGDKPLQDAAAQATKQSLKTADSRTRARRPS